MNEILVKRMVIGIIVATVLFSGYWLFRRWTLDPDIGSFDSMDMITAVEYTDEGSQIVLFDSEGNKTVVPDTESGRMDREPVWRPDGQRIFFVSDRDDQPYNIFRWNPAKNKVELRSRGTRSKSSPYFGPPDWPGLADSGLTISGGSVHVFNQKLMSIRQVLPPANFEGTSGEEAQGKFNALYVANGHGIRSAMWGPDRKTMYCVMRRDTDEVFVVNYLETVGEIPVGPQVLFAGDSIQFDVGSDGTAVVSVRGFQYLDPNNIEPVFIKDGTAYKPYTNATYVVQVQETGQLGGFRLDTTGADLGIIPGQMTDEYRQANSIPTVIDGVPIANVVPKYGAANIGMKAGDVLISVNGVETKTEVDMLNAQFSILIGEPVKIRYYDSGEDGGVREATYSFGQEPARALSDIAISPDSTMIAAVVGTVEGGVNFTSFEMHLIPLSEDGMRQRRRLVRGTVFEPSWHPSGKSLVYAKSGPSGDSQLYTINADGSRDRIVSGVGDYGQPSFSPVIRE